MRGWNTPREALIDAIATESKHALEIVDALDHYLSEGPEPPVIRHLSRRRSDLEARIVELSKELSTLAALRMRAVKEYKVGSGEMEWVPNSANPKKARRVSAPEKTK